MSEILATMSNLLSDDVLFPVLQGALVALVLVAFLCNEIQARRAGRGGAKLTVTRGEKSMSIFYGTYAAITGLLVAICLSVDIARNHRTLWVALDTILVAYICLGNPCSRSLLLSWANRLTKIETR